MNLPPREFCRHIGTIWLSGLTSNEKLYFPNSLWTDLGSDNELNLVARVGPVLAPETGPKSLLHHPISGASKQTGVPDWS